MMKRQVLSSIVAFGVLCLSGASANLFAAPEATAQGETPTEEAKAPPVVSLTGSHGDQIAVALLSLLSYSYYKTGEFDFARQYAQQSIAQYQGLKNPLKGEGLEEQVERAHNILAQIALWQKTPVIVEPNEISLVAGSEPSFVLKVQTREEVPLTFVSNNDKVTASLIKAGATQAELYTGQMVLVRVAPDAMKPGFKANLTLSSEKLPGVKVQVPLTVVEKGKITPAQAGTATASIVEAERTR